MLTHTLSDRLEGFELGDPLDGVDPETFTRAVIHGHENRGMTFVDRDGAGQIGAPYLVGLFRDDELRLALARAVEVIGEAAYRVSDTIKEQHPDIPWNQIIATRHRLIPGTIGSTIRCYGISPSTTCRP